MSEKRDLKKDLEICEKATPGPWTQGFNNAGQRSRNVRYDGIGCICSCSQDYGPKTKESIANATFIAAAREGWPEAVNRAITAESQIATLTEENDIQRQAIQNLSAQVVGLTDCLLSFPFKQHNPECGCPECQWLGKREKFLKEPDPGAEIRERLAKLEKVAEAAQAVCGLGWTDNYSTMVPLKQALASLKGGIK